MNRNCRAGTFLILSVSGPLQSVWSKFFANFPTDFEHPLDLSPSSGLLWFNHLPVNLENHRVFQKVDAYAGDPILSLMERFKDDARSDKVNLSIGLYYNEDGIIPQLKAVQKRKPD